MGATSMLEPNAPGGATTVDQLLEESAADAQPIAATFDVLADHPKVEAYLQYGVPFSTGAIGTPAALKDVGDYRALVRDPHGAAWMDNTTIVTATELMSDHGPEIMTPLTIWDLATFGRAVTCYDRVYHHAHPQVDDAAINLLLGDQVVIPVPLAYEAIEQRGAPSAGAHRLMTELWDDAYRWLRSLANRQGTDTLDGQCLEEIRQAWQRALGAETLNAADLVDYREVNARWQSPSDSLLDQTADVTSTSETRLYIDSRPRNNEVDERNRQRRRSELLSDLNIRAHVNQRLADFFEIPYVCAAARVPFRRFLYNRAVAVRDRLPSIQLLDQRYAELSEKVSVRLPVLLAVALTESLEPVDVWLGFAELRSKSRSFREKRVELDAALSRRDLEEVARVAKALTMSTGSVSSALGEMTAKAGTAIVPELAKGNLDQVALGVAAGEAAVRSLVSSSIAQRILWRLRRPHLLWLNDQAAEARRLTESLPQIARLWQLPEREEALFARRFDAMTQLADPA